MEIFAQALLILLSKNLALKKCLKCKSAQPHSASCGSSLLKKKNSTRLEQLRKGTGELAGVPKARPS